MLSQSSGIGTPGLVVRGPPNLSFFLFRPKQMTQSLRRQLGGSPPSIMKIKTYSRSQALPLSLNLQLIVLGIYCVTDPPPLCCAPTEIPTNRTHRNLSSETLQPMQRRDNNGGYSFYCLCCRHACPRRLFPFKT